MTAALLKETHTIPIVFTGCPIPWGITSSSLARPGET